MNLLIQSVRRTHLENLKPVWEGLCLGGHKLWFWIFQDAELSYDQNTLKNWQEQGWNVIEGDYQGLTKKKDYSSIWRAFTTSQPDLLLPLKHATDVWKETTRALDLSPWAGKIFTFQDAFSALRGKGNSPASLPTSSKSMIPWFFVWGKHYKEKLLHNGFPEDRIIITGNPAWDWCTSTALPLARYILFLGGAPQDWLSNIDFRQIYHDFESEIFVFKDHPVQADKKYSLKQNLIHLKMFPNKRIKLLNHFTATELIKEAKVVITTTSSCAIESMLCRKPTIIVDTCEESKKFNSSGRLIPRTYFSFSRELKNCLEKKEDQSKIPEFLKYAIHSPGSATQQTIEAIERVPKSCAFYDNSWNPQGT